MSSFLKILQMLDLPRRILKVNKTHSENSKISIFRIFSEFMTKAYKKSVVISRPREGG